MRSRPARRVGDNVSFFSLLIIFEETLRAILERGNVLLSDGPWCCPASRGRSIWGKVHLNKSWARSGFSWHLLRGESRKQSAQVHKVCGVPQLLCRGIYWSEALLLLLLLRHPGPFTTKADSDLSLSPPHVPHWLRKSTPPFQSHSLPKIRLSSLPQELLFLSLCWLSSARRNSSLASHQFRVTQRESPL